MNRINEILLYGGLNKDRYAMVQDSINEYNRKNIIIFSIIVAILGLALSGYAMSIDSVVKGNLISYLIMVVGDTTFFLMNLTLSKRFLIILNISVYAFIVFSIFFGMLTAVNGAEDLTATYMVMIIMTTLLFVVRPVDIAIIIVISNTIYVFLMYKYQEPRLFEKDLINAIVYGFLSIAVGTSSIMMKMKNFEVDNLNRKLMRTDVLTSLLNKNAYLEVVAEYEKQKPEENLVYVAFDVNSLKNVNDNYGHEAGDQLIYQAAKCISDVFSRYGRLFRTGGDEFVGLLHISEANMHEELKNFHEAVKQSEGVEGNPLSISFGFATANDMENANFDELAKLADERMYQDKDAYYAMTGKSRRNLP